jgi:hypothetical protein
MLKPTRNVAAQSQYKRHVMRRRSAAQAPERRSIIVTVTVTGKAMRRRESRALSKGCGLSGRRPAMGQLPEMASAVGVWHNGR